MRKRVCFFSWRTSFLSQERLSRTSKMSGKQSAVLKVISSEWKRDAIKEKGKYFYDDGEISQLANGEKYFVIGRKGSGKTAIADYINSIDAYNFFQSKYPSRTFHLTKYILIRTKTSQLPINI